MSPEQAVLPYATWPSPISTAEVARSGPRPAYPTVAGGQVWWTEDRPAEGGRTTIMRRDPDGALHELLAAPWSARTRVHEYGGRSYAVVPGGGVVFANLADQRLHLVLTDGEPRPITPEPDRDAALRYADMTVRDGRVWCVRERHHDDGRVSRSIVSVPLDGSAEPHEHVGGSDFYAYPELSPDGEHLAYICWDHPRMPWNGTELRITRLADGRSRTLCGGPAESVLAPRWCGDRHLYLVSDRSGWWNLYRIALDGTAPEALHPAEEEFAGPLWQLGAHPYAVLDDGRIAVLHGRGDLRLGVLDPADGTLTDLDVPYTGWAPALDRDGRSLAGIGYGPATPRSVVRLDLPTGRAEELRQDAGEPPETAYLPSRGAWRSRAGPAGGSTRSSTRRRTRGAAGRAPLPTSCPSMAAPPRTARAHPNWKRRSSPAGASACSTSTTAAPPDTAAPTATGCAASGGWWTSRT